MSSRLLCLLTLLSTLPVVAGVSIMDPAPGAYVSGEYEVVLRLEDPQNVTKTRLWVNGAVVWEQDGAVEKITHDFGESVARHEIHAEITDASGETRISDTVVTKALKFDYEETTRLILLGVVAKTRSNKPLIGLEQKQFRVFDNGVELPVKTFYKEKLPLDLVFLLDTSSSLRKTGLPELKHASRAFLKGLAPADRVSLIEFKNQPHKLVSFTNDHKKLNAAIDGLYPKGATALFDGLLQAVDVLEHRKRGRKAIVLFTDGRDSVYEEPEDKVRLLRRAIRLAQNTEITIFTIGLGKRLNKGALQRLADQTGGRYHFADKPDRLAGIFAEIILDLKNQYMIGVTPNSSTTGYHRLEVKVKKRGARVYARKGYSLE